MPGDELLPSTPRKSMNRFKTRSKRFIALLASLIIGMILVYSGLQSKNSSQAHNNTSLSAKYQVVQVVDGDTAEISINGQTKKVRFIGMDTPEVVDPRKTVQCYGREASNRAHELLDDQYVSLEYDNKVGQNDKYGRTLAYIIMADGTNYNQKMIAEGYAHEYTYSSQTYKYQAEFKSAQVNAETSQLGLWSPNTCGGNTKQPAK